MKPLLVLSPFSVAPARFGGSIRIFHLLREVARYREVKLFSQQVGRSGLRWSLFPLERELASGWVEHASRNLFSIGHFAAMSFLLHSPPIGQAAVLKAAAPRWLRRNSRGPSSCRWSTPGNSAGHTSIGAPAAQSCTLLTTSRPTSASATTIFRARSLGLSAARSSARSPSRLRRRIGSCAHPRRTLPAWSSDTGRSAHEPRSYSTGWTAAPSGLPPEMSKPLESGNWGSKGNRWCSFQGRAMLPTSMQRTGFYPGHDRHKGLTCSISSWGV